MDNLYRAVKANDSDDVIAIGCDEDQGGKDYNGIGVWADFTFTEIPTIEDSKVIEFLQIHQGLNALKIKDETIVVKTLEELESEIKEPVIEEVVDDGVVD